MAHVCLVIVNESYNVDPRTGVCMRWFWFFFGGGLVNYTLEKLNLRPRGANGCWLQVAWGPSQDSSFGGCGASIDGRVSSVRSRTRRFGRETAATFENKKNLYLGKGCHFLSFFCPIFFFFGIFLKGGVRCLSQKRKTVGPIVLHAQSTSSIMTLSAATRPSPEGKSSALHQFWGPKKKEKEI